MLNLFAYSGGVLGRGGARRGRRTSTSVDSSAAGARAGRGGVAAERSRRPTPATFVRADVFEYLRGDVPPADLVVLDPPPFARRRTDRERARAGYKDVNLRALRVAAPGALLLTFSCSQHVDAGEWEDAVAAAAPTRDARASCSRGSVLASTIRRRSRIPRDAT